MFSSLPLKGILILDLTTVVMGPYATQVLADLGAEVIKIEEPEGDMTRAVGPSVNPNMSSLFLGINRNKKSITLNLKNAKAKEVLWKLVKKADVFIHNIRPQKIASLGFDPDSILKKNKKIIYVGLHGYGEKGVYGGMPAYDDVIQGQSGLAATFMKKNKEPSLVPSVIADKTIGLIASTSILSGYIQRLKTRKGLYIEVSMFEGMVANIMIEHQFGSTFIPPLGSEGYTRVISRNRKPFTTADGYICMLAYTDKQWERFWKITNNKIFLKDNRFSSAAKRLKYIDIIYDITREILLKKTTNEWIYLLNKAEIPAGRVNKLKDLKNDPHLKSLNFFRKYNHPSEGKIIVPDTGIKINRKSLPIRIPQPNLGEHNKEIFSKLGYSDKEIEDLLKL